jgi:hypothetical protein
MGMLWIAQLYLTEMLVFTKEIYEARPMLY